MALPIANVAKYELTLPSQQKTISFRPFLVKEEKILLVALESGKPEEMLVAVKEIVKACTFGAQLNQMNTLSLILNISFYKLDRKVLVKLLS